jgi:hypothetical protein
MKASKPSGSHTISDRPTAQAEIEKLAKDDDAVAASCDCSDLSLERPPKSHFPAFVDEKRRHGCRFASIGAICWG